MLKIEASDLKRLGKELAKNADVEKGIANRIVSREFRMAKLRLAKSIARYTGLNNIQARKRIIVSRGVKKRKPWTYRALLTFGRSLVIQAGRLTAKQLGKGQGVMVMSKRFPTGFFLKPKGSNLKGRKRKVYRRTIQGLKSVHAKDVHGRTIEKAYKRVGPALLRRTMSKIVSRILKEAIRV